MVRAVGLRGGNVLYDGGSIRRISGVELTADVVPDETTSLRFRHLLEKHQFTQQLARDLIRLTGAELRSRFCLPDCDPAKNS